MSKQQFTPEFKVEAVRQITERGYAVSEVSERLGFKPVIAHRGQVVVRISGRLLFAVAAVAESGIAEGTVVAVRRIGTGVPRMSQYRAHQDCD